MALPVRPGMTVPLPGPLHSQREQLDRARRPRVHRHLVGRGRRPRRVHAARARRGLGTAPPPRHRDRARRTHGRRRASRNASHRWPTPRRAGSPIGIGTSSNVIVERWNGIPFEEPYKKVRDVVRFLRDALAGEKVTRRTTRSRSRASASACGPSSRRRSSSPRSAKGCCASPAAKPTARSSTGSSPEDVRRSPRSCAMLPAARTARSWPASSCARARTPTRCGRAPGSRSPPTSTCPVYAEFHGGSVAASELQGMWDAWAAGDRKAAMAAIPDAVVDALVVHGSAEVCRRRSSSTSTTGSRRRRWRSSRSIRRCRSGTPPDRSPRTPTALRDAVGSSRGRGPDGHGFGGDRPVAGRRLHRELVSPPRTICCAAARTARMPTRAGDDRADLRFEGQSDPDDETIVFALSEPGGRRGMYSAPYGAATPAGGRGGDRVDVGTIGGGDRPAR